LEFLLFFGGFVGFLEVIVLEFPVIYSSD